MTKSKKVWTTIAIVLLIALAVFFYFRFYFVFGVGAKNGQLNYVVKKGYLFKTYEGKVVQSGFQTDNNKGIQSNEFVFSVVDEDVADKLMSNQGKEVWLHYKEYLGRLPWRGHSKYVVDSIVMIKSGPDDINTLPPMFE